MHSQSGRFEVFEPDWAAARPNAAAAIIIFVAFFVLQAKTCVEVCEARFKAPRSC